MCGLIFLSFGGEDVADYAFRTLEDRQKIEKLWEDGRTPKEISETTGVSVHVVYKELTRGQDGTRLPDQRLRYSADVAQFLRSDFWGLNEGGGERQRGRCRWPGNAKAPGRHKAIRGQVTTL